MKKIYFTLSILILASTSCSNTPDWAALKHYKDANRWLKENPGSGKNKVVFMGDSIMEYWLTADNDFFTQNPYSDRGISGQTTSQILLRFRQDVIELHPKLVVILGGTNDISKNNDPAALGMAMGNIISMAELAKAHHIEVVLCSVLPTLPYPWKFNVAPVEKIVALNEMIRSYAKRQNIAYVDFHSAMKTRHNEMIKAYSNDGVHPNQKGYAVMKPLVQQAIATVLDKK